MLFQFSLCSSTEAMLVPLWHQREASINTKHHTLNFWQNNIYWRHRVAPKIRKIRGMALESPSPCHSWDEVQWQRIHCLTTEVRQAQHWGTFPQGPFPSGVTLSNSISSPGQDSAPRKQRLRKMRRQKKMPQREELRGVQLMCSFSSKWVFH